MSTLDPAPPRSSFAESIRGLDLPARVALGLILLLATFETYRYRTWGFDDAYIYFRVVQNMAHGSWGFNFGQVYNPCTSPIYPILLLILSGFDRIPLLFVSHLLAWVGIVLFAASVYGCIAPTSRIVALGTALASIEYQVCNVSWGLELHLVWGLDGLLLYLASRDIPRGLLPSKGVGVLLGLAMLGRPDQAVFVVLYLAWWLLGLPRGSRRLAGFVPSCGVAAVVMLPWLLFSYRTFGQAFPATLAAKRWQGKSGLWGPSPVYYNMLREYIQTRMPMSKWFLRSGLAGALLILYRRNALAVFCLFALVQQTAYFLLNVPGYQWYFQSLELSAIVGTGFLLASLVAWKPVARLEASRPVGLAAMALAALFVAFRFVAAKPVLYDPRIAGYEDAARWMREDAVGQPRSVAAAEPGTVAFFSGLPMIDIVGLATPNPPYIVEENVDRYYGAPADFFLVHRPMWGMEKPIFDDPRFKALYHGFVDVGSATTNPLRVYTKESRPSS